MKVVMLIACIFYLINFLSCSKERILPFAVLSFRFADRNEDVEWQEVAGSRYFKSGNLFITANGYDYEQFHLEFENIVSTGTVPGITSKNISYSNIYGFKTGSLQAVKIDIKEINNHRLYGTIEVAFVNSANCSDIIKAKGVFSILGQE